jgi:hypothetical protein
MMREWQNAIALSTNAANLILPPLDTKKWGKWMARRDHAGRTDLAYNDNNCKCEGVLAY